MYVSVCVWLPQPHLQLCVAALSMPVWPFSIGALSVWGSQYGSGAFLPLLTVHNWNYNSIYAWSLDRFVCYTLLFNYIQCTLEIVWSGKSERCNHTQPVSQPHCALYVYLYLWLSLCSCKCICICNCLALPAVDWRVCLCACANKFDSIVRLFLAVCFIFQLISFSGLSVVKY